jgi:hypothetical protein
MWQKFHLLGYNVVENDNSQPTFQSKLSPPLSELKSKPRKKMHETCRKMCLAHFQTLKMEAICSSEMVAFTRLNGVISQKIELLTATAVVT